MNRENFSNKPSQNKNDSKNIFEILKEIKDYTTNEQLISYFKFAKFYGLLEPEKNSILEEAERNLTRKNKILFFGISISSFSSLYLYKRNYYNASFICLCVMAGPLLYFNYTMNRDTNFLLLKLKDDYFYQLDRFFKEDKNPLILNPNFLIEDIVDPDLKVYQSICKLNLLKK